MEAPISEKSNSSKVKIPIPNGIMERSLKVIEKKNIEPPKPQQMFLPGFQDWLRAMPNHIARSSLFAPPARGKKQQHDELILVSRSDAILTYTGEQLDECQADVWMQLIKESKGYALGEGVPFHSAAFLRSIGRNTSGPNYTWLYRTLKAFTKATIVIKAKKKDGSTKYYIGKTSAFHMLAGFDYIEDEKIYIFTIDPRWKKIFGENEYALINFEKRMGIGRNQFMARSLQRLIATSSDSVQRYQIAWLKEMLVYGGRMRDFRDALMSAMKELERVEVIAGAKIELSTRGQEQTVWTKLRDEDRS